MICSLLTLALFTSFQIGPAMGAFVPVQEKDDPWRTSFIFGVRARYGLSFADLESQLMFAELAIDPDSSRGFDYSVVPLTLGFSRRFAGVRAGLGGALYSIKAEMKIDDGLAAVWEGTYPGMYLSVGRDFGLLTGTADVSARFHIIDFNGLWIALTASLLL